MAKLLWGNVFLYEQFAGVLRQEPGGGSSFTYDPDYVDAQHSPVSYTLPIQRNSFKFSSELPPYFDNLAAEGWLAQYQSRVLGRRSVSRFELLLAFGYDCIGAVSIRDPEPSQLSEAMLDLLDPKQAAVYTSHASLSGVQPKLAMLRENGQLRSTRGQEVSTHIVKFASPNHPNILINEYLTTNVLQTLLPDDAVANLSLEEIPGFTEPALVIQRFDRSDTGQRQHFEEFNQLLQYLSTNKYDASYADMAAFMRNSSACLPTEIYRLFQRVVVGFLLGNTDMHLKNFAMFHTKQGLRLTPSYDFVAAKLFDYPTIALAIANSSNLQLGKLKYRHIYRLAEEFQLPEKVVIMLAKQLKKRLTIAKQVITDCDLAPSKLRQQFIAMVEKRWNGTFALIGQR